jgi:MoxR-like ATPase
MSDWYVFRGDGTPHSGIERVLDDAPPWRDFSKQSQDYRGRTYQADQLEIELVNVALRLRRPLLVTGPPGSGKSSLAYAVAHELLLGRVLVWPINSRTVLADGLYTYDALGRLREAQLAATHRSGLNDGAPDIGRFIRLNALGTALYPGDRPRVLLIDEIDKSDIDLPGDLLHVLEEGSFEIPELVQHASADAVHVHRSDPGGEPVPVAGGRVRCNQFPLIILTSNGERELPPAFHRLCLRLQMQEPDEKRLTAIVAAHLGETEDELTKRLISQFIERRRSNRLLAIDQLLNAVYLVAKGRLVGDQELSTVIVNAVLQELNR